MGLFQQIEAEVKEAMKAKQEVVLSTLRLARTALKNRQIDLQHELSDDEVLAVMRTMVKQYRDALNDFLKAGRQDLVERQRLEIEVLERYLPVPLTDVEIETLCREQIDALQATPQDMGKVMGAVLKKAEGKADGARVRSIVERLLS